MRNAAYRSEETPDHLAPPVGPGGVRVARRRAGMRGHAAIGGVAAVLLAVASPASATGPNATVLISRPSGTGPLPLTGAGSAATARKAISGDGRLVVFTSGADDLGVGDTTLHVWVRDTATDVTRLVDRVPGGGPPGDGRAREASISRDGSTVCFIGEATNLVAGVTGTHVFVVTLSSGAIVVADRATGADGAIGDGAPDRCALDATGTRVVFESRASNLVGGDTNGMPDVFLRDLGTGETTRVSVDATGAEAPNGGRWAAIDADGTRVAFSTSDPLVVGDTNDFEDVYVRDVPGDGLVRASVGTGSVEGNGPSFDPAIDDAGTHVAFASLASNLGLGADTNDVVDVFWRDLGGSDTTIAVSVATGTLGALGDQPSRTPAISGDGLGVAFESTATNLDEDAPPGVSQVYLRRLGVDETHLLSRAGGAAGAPAEGGGLVVSLGTSPTVAAWTGFGAMLHPDAPGEFGDVFKRVLGPTPETILVSRPTGTGPRNAAVNDSFARSRGMSADARLVVLQSKADGLDPAAAGRPFQIFVRDIVADTLTLVSRGPGPAGAAGNDDSLGNAISAGGTHVAFLSRATNLLDGVTTPQIYVRELATGNLEIASRADGPDGEPAAGIPGSEAPDVSADGTRVAFTAGGALVDDDTNMHDDVYLRDLPAGRTTLVTVAADGGPANGRSSNPALSDDGTRVAFMSQATNLLEGTSIPPGAVHVYVRDLVSLTTELVDRRATDGAPGTGNGLFPEISGNGNRVVFRADEALTADAVPPGGVLYVRDLATDTTLLASRGDGPQGAAVTSLLAPSLNHDGTLVSFTASGPELPSAPELSQVFVRDLAADTTILASVADGTTSTPANRAAGRSALSAGGGCLAFDSAADNLTTPGYPTRDFSQVYLRVLSGSCPPPAPSTTSTTLPPALANDTPVAAKTVVLRPGKLLKVVARGAFPLPDDPQTAGAVLTVGGTTGVATYALPANGWKRLGRRTLKGFRFRGDGCRLTFGRKGIAAVCRGQTGDLALPEAGPLRITLATGARVYCAECGGRPAGKPTRLFKRKRCDAPASCRLAP